MVKYNRYLNMLLLLTEVMFVSCSSELTSERPENVSQVLSVEVNVSRADGMSDEADGVGQSETRIKNIQILIFNSEGNRTPSGYFHYDEMEGNRKVRLAAGDWKRNRELFDRGPDAAYSVYAIANHHQGSRTLENVRTVDELRQAVDTDLEIWKSEGALVERETYSGKIFCMSGVKNGFVPSINAATAELKISMRRVAAKVEVNVSFDNRFGDGFQPEGFFFGLRNYASKGLLCEEDGTEHLDRGISGNGGEYRMANALSQNLNARTARMILYTYPADWTDDITNETYVLLNIPGRYKEEPNSLNSVYKAGNYYKIPIRAGGNVAFSLTRNTACRINVTIDRFGQVQPEIPVELSGKIVAVPWQETMVTVDSEPVTYLEILKNEIIMKGVAESDKQYFTSSTPVTARIEEVYFFDKFGIRHLIPQREYASYGIRVVPQGQETGYVHIHSDIPLNNGIRYIKVRLENGQGKSKGFLVKQYPLEYIVTVPGWYSFRTDFVHNGSYLNWESPNLISSWEVLKTNNAIFFSKVYTQNKIVKYSYYNDSYYWRKYIMEPERGQNHNMYFVRITKTSNKYELAVPAIDSEGYTDNSEENNRLVSPAFMIASQLGTVSPTDFYTARKHCEEYAEKSLAGELYTDWRLPTEAELAIIDKYQNTPGSVIDIVLGGKQYWAASGNRFVTENGDYPQVYNAYIRCIRTVKPNEVITNEND